jgi:hypothetical protein
MMNWEAIGAIGEIVGATAVVASLLYLAVQMRRNAQEARVTNRQAITRANNDWMFQIAAFWLLSAVQRTLTADWNTPRD